MTDVFADTFYWLALMNRLDEAHSRAARESTVARRRFVTTAWVLVEVGDALCGPAARQGFRRFWDSVRTDPHTEIVAADQALLERGIDLYLRRPDKSWSLTDCISFTVMEERGIRDALTGDHHFEQAGFVAVLK